MIGGKTYTLDSRFAFVDVETTGSVLPHDRIIEIGILVVECGQVVETFRSFVNPERARIPPFIQSLTHISPRDLVDAPTFISLHEKLHALLKDAVFVAHNARFDYGFLQSEFKRAGVDFKEPSLCTVKLSRSLFPRFTRHNLDEVVSRSGIKMAQRHRAFDDAQALWHFLQYVQTQFDRPHLNKKIHNMVKTLQTSCA